MKNTEYWDEVKRPPETALKTIKGGRLSGMTDISPQWRYQVMTEVFGPCGIGWKWEITRTWSEEHKGDILAFAEVNVYIKDGDKWSDPIPGTGGSRLVTMESKGVHISDEGYKMAVTDALSVGLKMLGVGSDIYMGKFDGSKYIDAPEPDHSSKGSDVQHEEFKDDIPYDKGSPEKDSKDKGETPYGINYVLRLIDNSSVPAHRKTELKEIALQKPEGVLEAWAKGFLETRLKQESV